jgi:hypothetical protein
VPVEWNVHADRSVRQQLHDAMFERGLAARLGTLSDADLARVTALLVQYIRKDAGAQREL